MNLAKANEQFDACQALAPEEAAPFVGLPWSDETFVFVRYASDRRFIASDNWYSIQINPSATSVFQGELVANMNMELKAVEVAFAKAKAVEAEVVT